MTWHSGDRTLGVSPCRCAVHNNVAKILSASLCQASRVYCLINDMMPRSCCETKGIRIWQALRRYQLGQALREYSASGRGSAGLDASHCSRGDFRTDGDGGTLQVRPAFGQAISALADNCRHMAQALVVCTLSTYLTIFGARDVCVCLLTGDRIVTVRDL